MLCDFAAALAARAQSVRTTSLTSWYLKAAFCCHAEAYSVTALQRVLQHIAVLDCTRTCAVSPCQL